MHMHTTNTHTHTYTCSHTPRHTHKVKPNGKSQIEKHKTQIQRQAKREDYGEIQQHRMVREAREEAAGKRKGARQGARGRHREQGQWGVRGDTL